MELHYQDPTGFRGLPRTDEVREWAVAAAAHDPARRAELTVRVVSVEESAELNGAYRQRFEPANVLSFRFEDPPGVESGILGDVAVCAEVVAREAREQGKTFRDHFAHMVVHGVLHLCGYDHAAPSEARAMETLETAILARCGFRDPYR